ncbi:MAG TPA: TetR/AcrR family transcriptional regulator, partial [Mesorhizobium sp.]
MGAKGCERSFEALSTEAACARILERNRDAISVQKQHLAVANLARIIEATLKLSNKQGFHAMTLRELARESGLSMGGLYSYISHKEALLSMILREVSATVNDALSAPPAALRGNPAALTRWLIETHIRLTEAMQPWFVFAFMEAKSFPAPARKMAVDSERATEAIFEAAIRSGIDAGLFQVQDPELAASLIKPLIQDWYVKRSKYRKRGVSIERYIETVTVFVEAALQA